MARTAQSILREAAELRRRITEERGRARVLATVDPARRGRLPAAERRIDRAAEQADRTVRQLAQVADQLRERPTLARQRRAEALVNRLRTHAASAREARASLS